MPNWTKDDLKTYQARRQKLRSAEPECPERRPLGNSAPGEPSGGIGVDRRANGRYRITFRCYSVRPLDWDNYRLKSLQDALVKCGLLPDDAYSVLQGEVIS